MNDETVEEWRERVEGRGKWALAKAAYMQFARVALRKAPWNTLTREVHIAWNAVVDVLAKEFVYE